MTSLPPSGALEVLERMRDAAIAQSAGDMSSVYAVDAVHEFLTAELAARSGGAFDVTVGPCVSLWRKARREKKMPDAAKLEVAKDELTKAEATAEAFRHLIEMHHAASDDEAGIGTTDVEPFTGDRHPRSLNVKQRLSRRDVPRRLFRCRGCGF